MSLADPRWPRWLPAKLVVAIATLGPLGQRLPAPGTWGSAAGLLYFAVCFWSSRWEVIFAWAVIGAAVAVGLTGEAARRIGREDPGEVILDEFIVMPLVFLGWRQGPLHSLAPWVVLVLGFLLFRLFDILKPAGIARLQRWPGGWGIVADDFAAALAACGVLHAIGWLWSLR